MKKIKGFTLVEILIVIAILLLMMMILIGILNPVALVNKARDSRKKKDLSRIKVAFEEYYNDKGCYPNVDKVGQLIVKENCGSREVFSPWYRPWPCDPSGEPYQVVVGYDSTCPKWFKILTVLENKQDVAINITGVSATDYNYGVSSDNISPGGYLGDNNPNCAKNGCYYDPPGDDQNCNGISACNGPNCFNVGGCSPSCRVTCCGDDCD